MTVKLEKFDFTEKDFDEVQSFDCGNKPYQIEVSEWIKAPLGFDGALESIKRIPPATVCLYRIVPDGPIVGFGAMDKARDGWRWKGKKDPKIPTTLILWYAVQIQYQKKPIGDIDKHFSSQILDDLIACAYDDQMTHPVLGLCVQPDNKTAIELYKRKGFTDDLLPYIDKNAGKTYKKMAKVLNSAALLTILEIHKKT